MLKALRALLGAAAIAAVPAPGLAEGLLVFAAASLRGALDEVGAAWAGAPVTISYGGSAMLARQIEAGAPADLFVSAHQAWMSHLSDLGLISESREILSNRLVLVGPQGQVEPAASFAAALDALPEDARLATGLLNAVPAGIYARQALTTEQMLHTLMPRIVQTENVRIALALAARGEVARALVYRSDAMAEPGVAIEVLIPQFHHQPIRYPAGIVANGDHPEAADFLTFLSGAEAGAVFAGHGFEVLE